MSGLSLCSWLRLQLLSMISPSLFLGSRSSHCEPLTISRSVNSPWGCRTLAELTINRALQNHIKEIPIEKCHSAETEPFPQEGIDCNDIFHIVFGATQPEFGGLCPACHTLLQLFCLLFIPAQLWCFISLSHFPESR